MSATVTVRDMTFIFRRGFVAEVTLRLADWCGQECARCEGRGYYYPLNQIQQRGCPVCHGTGRTGGYGPQLVRAAPIEYVVLTDKKPVPAQYRPARSFDPWYWLRSTREARLSHFELPAVIFDLLDGKLDGNLDLRDYRSEAAALDALSTACLTWAGSPVFAPVQPAVVI